MNRRELFKTAAAASAAAALPAQAQEVRKIEESPLIAGTSPEAVAKGSVRFFSSDEFAALERLTDILVPGSANAPGALAAGVAAFLDFLLSESVPDRQRLYKTGVSKLNEEARRLHGKAFAGLSNAEAAPILKPLGEPWTYRGPTNLFSRFLTTAKEEVWQATQNSREWSQAAASRSRSAGGVGLYWLPVE